MGGFGSYSGFGISVSQIISNILSSDNNWTGLNTFSKITTFNSNINLGSGLSISDANSVPLINFPTTITSAVNYIQILNSVTGVAPSIQASGSDPNIAIVLAGKGPSGTVSIDSFSGSHNFIAGPTSTLIYKTLQFLDAAGANIQCGTSSGIKFGTATNQKIGFWNAIPIIQPTTGGASSVFVANTSGIADDTATWDGYTIGNIVKALRNMGLLA